LADDITPSRRQRQFSTITVPGLAAGDEDESSADEIILDLCERISTLEQIVEKLLSKTTQFESGGLVLARMEQVECLRKTSV